MSVKELFRPEDSRLDAVSGIDFHINIKLQEVLKVLVWISAAVLITGSLGSLS